MHLRHVIETRRLLVAGTLVGVLALGACSGDDGTDATTTAAPASTAAPTTTPTTTAAPEGTLVPPGPSMIVDVETAPGSEIGAESGDDDTTVDTCGTADGRWEATGTVTNPTDAAADYRVYITFMDGSRIVALVEATVDAVEPGATQEWTDGFAGDTPGLECVVRVEREPA